MYPALPLLNKKFLYYLSSITILLSPSTMRAASLTWTGAVDQNWTTVNTSNWLNGVTPASFANGDTVIFDDTAVGIGSVTVKIAATNVITATVTAPSMGITFNNATRDYFLEGPGIITGGPSGGATSLRKSGAGKLTLSSDLSTSSVNFYLSGGTLELAGGNNRLPTNKAFFFDGTSTLNLGGFSQSISTLITSSLATTTTYTVTNGSLTLTGGNLSVSPSGTTPGVSATLDLSGLAEFRYQNASGSVQVGAVGSTNTGMSGNLKLSLTSNTLIAAAIEVGAFDGTGTAQQARLTLGAANLIQASNFFVGAGASGNGQRADGEVTFAAGLTSPTFTLRGTSGGSSRSTIRIADSKAGSGDTTATVNLNGATVDILASTMTLGNYRPGNGAAVVTGSFLFDGGSVDAQTIILGQRAGGITGSPPPVQSIGLITQGGGTMKVQTLTLGDSNATASSGISGEYVLGGGSLYAATIQAGTNTNTNASSLRRISWNNGTIRNYDATTDLTINGVASGNGALGIVLANTGTHTFYADAGRSITVNSNVILSGTGGTLIKEGAGTLTLSAANTYTGTTSLNAGTLQAGNDAAFGTGSLALNGGKLTSDSTTARAISNAVTFGGDVTLGDGTNTGTLTFNGAGSLTGNRTLTTASNVTYAAAISGVGFGLTKTGAGTLTLTGVNTYTGATIVSAGSMVLSGGGSLANSAVVEVQAGATLHTTALGIYTYGSSQTVKGNGTITGNSILQGTLAAGNSPGILTFSNDLALASSANSIFEIQNTGTARGTDYDGVNVGGLLTYHGTLTLTLTTLVANGTYDLFAFTSIAGDFDSVVFSGLIYTGPFTENAGFWTANSNGQTFSFELASGDLIISAIPEPSTPLLLAGSLLILVLLRRARKSRILRF